jgi:hypothetical protein
VRERFSGTTHCWDARDVGASNWTTLSEAESPPWNAEDLER